jgi:hypothetical protein
MCFAVLAIAALSQAGQSTSRPTTTTEPAPDLSTPKGVFIAFMRHIRTDKLREAAALVHEDEPKAKAAMWVVVGARRCDANTRALAQSIEKKSGAGAWQRFRHSCLVMSFPTEAEIESLKEEKDENGIKLREVGANGNEPKAPFEFGFRKINGRWQMEWGGQQDFLAFAGAMLFFEARVAAEVRAEVDKGAYDDLAGVIAGWNKKLSEEKPSTADVPEEDRKLLPSDTGK